MDEKQEMTKSEKRQREFAIREIEHRLWQAREEKRLISRVELEDAYKRHVHESNWHNRIFSLAMVFAVTFLAATLAKVLSI